VEQVGVLRHHADGAAHGREREVANVHIVDLHGATIDVVEA
jgi:hypothetical protein